MTLLYFSDMHWTPSIFHFIPENMIETNDLQFSWIIQGGVVITPETVGTITPETTGTITPLTPTNFVPEKPL